MNNIHDVVFCRVGDDGDRSNCSIFFTRDSIFEHMGSRAPILLQASLNYNPKMIPALTFEKTSTWIWSHTNTRDNQQPPLARLWPLLQLTAKPKPTLTIKTNLSQLTFRFLGFTKSMPNTDKTSLTLKQPAPKSSHLLRLFLPLPYFYFSFAYFTTLSLIITIELILVILCQQYQLKAK